MSLSHPREELICSLKKCQQYLTKRVEKTPQYRELLDLLKSKLELCSQEQSLDTQFCARQLQQIQTEIKSFFHRHKQDLWQQIKQIKASHLAEKEVHYYRQNILKPLFHQLDRLQQQEFSHLKQTIHQYRQQYLNPFVPDSWMFHLERIIESSQVKVIREDSQQYLYPIIDNQGKTEYLYSYILGWYQTKVSAEIKSQWVKIAFEDGAAGLNNIITQINHKLQQLTIFDDSTKPEIALEQDLSMSPQLDITQFIDLQCLKLNSRIVFDYDYTKSSWFRLGIYLTVGLGIYWVTKLYFGQGRFIGFLIVILQLVNLITGQDPYQTKLKQHRKELKRTINQKYQNLLRLIVERLIQTIIITLELNKTKSKQQLDAIANLAHERLDAIEQTIQQHKTEIDTFAKDGEQLQSFLK